MKKNGFTLHTAICCAVTAVITALAVLAVIFCAFGGRDGLSFYSKVHAVKEIIDDKYVGDASSDDMADAAAAGMVSAAGDRWSYYMTAQQYEEYKDRSNNTSNGIGVTISPDEATGGFRIVSVANGSPAEAAGVEAGQVIISAAGEDVKGLSTDELKKLIQSQDGKFPLDVLNSDGTVESFEVYTDSFYSNPVSFKMLENSIGYVSISNFEAGAAENSISAIKELIQQGAKGIVFDVRGNPGGRLGELIELLDYLLPEGEIFVSVSKDGKEEIYTSDSEFVDMPMAVLINADSYSAAEFFAAALEEYGAAVTVGEATTGKGRSQATYELSDGSAVHISTRRYLTPNRVDLAAQGGLQPYIQVENSDTGDVQLDAAVKYLS